MTRAPRPSLWPYAVAPALIALFIVVLVGAW